MRMEEEFVGRRQQFADLLLKVGKQLEDDNFVLRGKKITFPDVDLEFKISHKSDFGENKLSISIEWLDEQA